MYKILSDKVVVPAASVDRILSSRPFRSVNANEDRLLRIAASGQQVTGTLCLGLFCQPTFQHSSRVSRSVAPLFAGTQLISVMSQSGALLTYYPDPELDCRYYGCD